MVSKAIKFMLAMDGHEVESATTGQQALDAFQAGQFDEVERR
jgi:CheY-like chemotaxis protein